MIKKVIANILVVGLVISMIGCGAKKEEPKKKEPTTQVQPSKPAPTKKVVVSEHVSNAPLTSIDTIHISPKHVYYENSKLVMEAYVYNGYSHAVYNINNVAIRLSNNSGVIAESQFGSLDGAQIGPKSYIVWKFVFDPSAIKIQNADLGYLYTESRCGNSY